MKLHFLLGSALVFGIPLMSAGLERLYPETKVNAGCAAGSTPQSQTVMCRTCDPTPCAAPSPFGWRTWVGSYPGLFETCIDWDGIPPGHCVSTPTDDYDLYKYNGEPAGRCTEFRCAQATSSAGAVCSPGWHP